MSTKDRGQKVDAKQVSRRQFLRRAGWSRVGVGALALGAPRGRAAAQAGLVSRMDPGQHQDRQAGRHPHAGLALGSADARSADDPVGRALPVRRPHEQSPRPLCLRRRGERPGRHDAQGRPRGVLVVQPRLSRLDLQAAPGREVAERAAAERARARRRRHQVLLRGLRQGRRADVQLQGDRGNRDAGQAHRARPHARRPTCSCRRRWPSPSR